jgi:hypothetical protein
VPVLATTSVPVTEVIQKKRLKKPLAFSSNSTDSRTEVSVNPTYKIVRLWNIGIPENIDKMSK